MSKQVELIASWPVTERDPLIQRINEVLKETSDAVEIKDFSSYRPFIQKDSHKPYAVKEDVKKIVFWNLPQKLKKVKLLLMPPQKLVLFMWEPPVVQKELYNKKLHAYFSKIYTWDDDLVDNKRFLKFCYPVLQKMTNDIVPFEQKKLCTMVFSNKESKHPQELYSARKELIEFFERSAAAASCLVDGEDYLQGECENPDFEFYGWGWENTGHKSYRGPVASKVETLKDYRFCFCYENMQGHKGYITEKIFDCFAAGSVPVYWGASNVEEYIPEGCFIDRRKFKDNEELYAFLKQMTQEQYEGYIERIKVWLDSESAQRFSIDQFAKLFAQI